MSGNRIFMAVDAL